MEALRFFWLEALWNKAKTWIFVKESGLSSHFHPMLGLVAAISFSEAASFAPCGDLVWFPIMLYPQRFAPPPRGSAAPFTMSNM